MSKLPYLMYQVEAVGPVCSDFIHQRIRLDEITDISDMNADPKVSWREREAGHRIVEVSSTRGVNGEYCAAAKIGSSFDFL